MDPIYPWLDPAEVRRLADHLMRPHRDPAVPVTDLGFDDGFVGYEANQPKQPVTSPPPTQPHDAPLPTPPPIPIIPVSTENPTAARGPQLERITRFRDWMHLHFSASGIFILNGEGSVIFDEGLHGRLHFLARSLALASRRPGTTVGNVHVKISATSILEVIPVETAQGYLVLGAVVPDSLDPKAITAVTEALSQVATTPNED
jgi:hypothetical protein